MGFLETVKKVLFDESSISQEIVVEKMKEQIQNLKNDYEELINLQNQLMQNPRDILQKEFFKKEKYIDLMDNIKYKDIKLIKDHEYLGMKYNILVELYNKLKKYISDINGDILLDFAIDKYKQPVAVMAPCSEDLHKILLIKNTYFEEDYINYNINSDNIIINDICSKEPNVSHGTFMMEMLLKTAKYYKQIKYPKLESIIVSKDLINKLNKNNGSLFFQKLGFMRDNEVFAKKIA